MNHIPQIKHALGIDAVETKIFAWQSMQKKGGSQIDLVLLRKDGIINLCEMKFTAEPFQVTLSTIEELDKKSSAFLRETHLDLPVRSTLISYQGIARGGYGVQIPVLITGDDLFKI